MTYMTSKAWIEPHKRAIDTNCLWKNKSNIFDLKLVAIYFRDIFDLKLVKQTVDASLIIISWYLQWKLVGGSWGRCEFVLFHIPADPIAIIFHQTSLQMIFLQTPLQTKFTTERSKVTFIQIARMFPSGMSNKVGKCESIFTSGLLSPFFGSFPHPFCIAQYPKIEVVTDHTFYGFFSRQPSLTYYNHLRSFVGHCVCICGYCANDPSKSQSCFPFFGVCIAASLPWHYLHVDLHEKAS